MKKDQIFWVVWAVVVGGALLFQFMFVAGMREQNKETLTKGKYLAARFNPEGELTQAIQHLMATSPADKKAYPKPKDVDAATLEAIGALLDKNGYDKRLWRFYPLSLSKKNLDALPSKKKLEDFKGLNQNLAKARAEFIKTQFPKYSFQVDPKVDFKPPAPAPEAYIPFRFWVRDQDLATDALFKKAGKNIEFILLEAELSRRDMALSWMPDGKVTGWIRDENGKTHPDDRDKVLRRLLLRRELLLTLARVTAKVEGIVRVGDGEAGGEPVEDVGAQLRGVDRIISLKFVDPPPPQRMPKECYIPHGVDIEVSCHLGVVPALLREIETIGQNRKDRPYAFWADKLLIRRASGWPSAADLSGELKSDTRYGRYNEWPVVVRISGVVPEFTDKYDPEPKGK